MRTAVLLLASVLVASLAPAHAETASAPAAQPSLAAAKQAAAAGGLAYLATVAAGNAAVSDGLVEAIEGVGFDPGLWPTPENNVLDRLYVPALGTTGNDPIREIHAYAQTGYPTTVGGRDLVADLRDAWGASAQTVGQASFTILGLHAAGLPDADPTIQDAVATLRGGQATGGFWVCDAAIPPQDVDCTGFALTALAAVHALTPAVGTLSKAFLDHARNADGGYEEHPDPARPGRSNTDSTVWAINGYRALGQPEPEECWRFILGKQNADGSFAWQAPGEQAITRTFATKEILASLWSSFAAWPTRASAPVGHGPVHADVASAFALPEAFTSATWAATGPDGAAFTATGTATTLAFPRPGDWTVHVDAQGAGLHARDRLDVRALNDPPAFAGTGPLEAVAGDAWEWSPPVADPEGQSLSLAWSVAGQQGTGPVRAVLPSGLWQATVTATDPHGASATLKVPVHARGALPAASAPVTPAAFETEPITLPAIESVAIEFAAGGPSTPEPIADRPTDNASPPATEAAPRSPDPLLPVEPVALPSVGLEAAWTSHDGVLDVAATADPAAYLTVSWCDGTGCHEDAVVEGHAFFPAGSELRDVQVQARLGGQVETASLGDLGAAAEPQQEPSTASATEGTVGHTGVDGTLLMLTVGIALALSMLVVLASRWR